MSDDKKNDNKKKAIVNFKQYKKMRNVNGGPKSFASFTFWTANGCKNKPGFLDSWNKKDKSKENKNRERCRDRDGVRNNNKTNKQEGLLVYKML